MFRLGNPGDPTDVAIATSAAELDQRCPAPAPERDFTPRSPPTLAEREEQWGWLEDDRIAWGESRDGHRV